MGRSIRRLVKWLLIGWIVTVAVSAVAALVLGRKGVSTDDPDADEIVLSGVFGSFEFESHATAFRGGELECWFGGGSLDLREATLDPGGATITVKAVYGGVQILVPDDWQVTTNIMSILGGAGDGRELFDRGSDAPHLTVEGVAVFGGIGVTD